MLAGSFLYAMPKLLTLAVTMWLSAITDSRC
jgi:hypothetical protein